MRNRDTDEMVASNMLTALYLLPEGMARIDMALAIAAAVIRDAGLPEEFARERICDAMRAIHRSDKP